MSAAEMAFVWVQANANAIPATQVTCVKPKLPIMKPATAWIPRTQMCAADTVSVWDWIPAYVNGPGPVPIVINQLIVTVNLQPILMYVPGTEPV